MEKIQKIRAGALVKAYGGRKVLIHYGSGSVIDSAKAIGYGVANEGEVWDFYEHTRFASACLPVGVILTISAAGSEMSNSSVITNEDSGKKRAYNDDLARPKFAIMNPALTMTLPDYQTACGCTDILMHTMEPEIMWAGSLSHNGLTGCGNDGGDFATHMLEHEIGGMFDVAHGAGLAAIWGSWARYVYKDCLPRFHRFAVNVMNIPDTGSPEEIALKGIEAMEDFYHSIHMPTSFGEMNLSPTGQQMKLMAQKCVEAAGGPKGSAKVLSEAVMLAIYEMAR